MLLGFFNFTMLLHPPSPRNIRKTSPLSPARPIPHLHMEKNSGCWQVGKVVLIKAITMYSMISSDFPDGDLLLIWLDSIYCEVQNSKATKKYMDLGM